MRRSTATIALAGGAISAAALWWRRNPSACPYGQRFWVETPHPFITRPRLHEVLEPEPGDRVLEVGPGTGYYTLDVARSVGPDGAVDIFDLQQEMLDHTLKRAEERGITNLTPTRGDARRLPYADATFDAAFLVAVLGEIPDQDIALQELARVLKPGGGSWSANCSVILTGYPLDGCGNAASGPDSVSTTGSAARSATSPAFSADQAASLLILPRGILASWAT